MPDLDMLKYLFHLQDAPPQTKYQSSSQQIVQITLPISIALVSTAIIALLLFVYKNKKKRSRESVGHPSMPSGWLQNAENEHLLDLMTVSTTNPTYYRSDEWMLKDIEV